ncbi:hypothetical protein GCM10011380_00400 [Sphingomonas metalli]|uniref:Uncharacterized protein n=1 Tax=Sphingomonas metalli TaxID=1779358 RepID=A0A916SRS8_9SPHN|nr:hypothetical protein [Sphingomonas metalli]GGB14912.1 hypothetical protein GCM10011380_00400 [Sphingomonas metalli]
MRGNSVYGARERTQADKANDCFAFIFNARPAALMAMTAERLCADKGVTNRQARREIEVRLLAAQDRERRRA